MHIPFRPNTTRSPRFGVRVIFMLFVIATAMPLVAFSESHARETRPNSRQLRSQSRPFWQDAETQVIHWIDLEFGGEWKKGGDIRAAVQQVEGFPELDQSHQMLVQMKCIDQLVMVGVRDDDGGSFGSGWVAFETGVEVEDHGDHMHWYFNENPKCRSTLINEAQGNPAHLYHYGRCFYLANDSLSGFTRFKPADLRTKDRQAAGRFFPGGSGHITLAVVDDEVAYSTWIDRSGENAGRVDIVSLSSNPATEEAQFLKLPSGGLHGATANSGRVFFAPSDGIDWIDTESKTPAAGRATPIHHFDLGKDPATDKPLRAGAFANVGSWVLFKAGQSEHSALFMVNAAEETPQLRSLNLGAAAEAKVTVPSIVQARGGKTFAFLFHEFDDSVSTEQLSIVDLDPDGDGDLSDAKEVHRMDVAGSEVEGHAGHHSAVSLLRGRYACFTNSGDGTLWVISLDDFQVIAKLQVGGKPERLLSVGE